MFEDDDDRRFYLRLLKQARDEFHIRIIAWVLMTDHVHLVADFGESPTAISDFMYFIDARYARYFNMKTHRSGTLFQGAFWSKAIADDAQLVATVHYVHMNPDVAGMAPMRQYRWSSYQEYCGKTWVVDTSVVLGIFGSFEAFDAYAGSPKDVVRKAYRPQGMQDEEVLRRAMAWAGVGSSMELRKLPPTRRNALVSLLSEEGISIRRIARTLGIGSSSVARILKQR